MSNDATPEKWDSADRQEPPAGESTVEAYEIDGGVVFYDAENPLAWVEATTTVRLREHA